MIVAGSSSRRIEWLNEQRRWPNAVSRSQRLTLFSLPSLCSRPTDPPPPPTMPALKDDMQMREDGFGGMQLLQLVFTVMRASV